MNATKFAEVHHEFETYSRDLLLAKGMSYSPKDDRLLNFKKAAQLQSETPIEACFGMMAKHLVSLADLVRGEWGSPENDYVWREKLADTINYCYLLWALVQEQKESK